MKTKILNENNIGDAVSILKNSGVVVFPTETVYGIGACINRPEAIKKIYDIKGRPSDNPLIVHLADRSWVYSYAEVVSDQAEMLMDKFWPGPLSIIFKKKNINDSITAGLNTVALRCPSDRIANKLITELGQPIAAPSANISGRPSSTRSEHSMTLYGKVDAILIGDHSKYGLESTVVDLSGDSPRLLRPGAITFEELREIIPNIKKSFTKDDSLKSPGLRYKHYSPESEVIIISGTVNRIKEFIKNNKENAIFFVSDEYYSDLYKNEVIRFSPQGDQFIAAHNLFDFLIKYDKKYDKIYFTGIEETGIGLAIMDRLLRASDFTILEV